MIITKQVLLFIYRLVKQVLKFLGLLPLQLLGAVVLLPVCSIQTLSSEHPQLPWFVRWFDNADIYPENNRTPVTYLTEVLPLGRWGRYTWLAWRNPLNYFSYKYLSCRPTWPVKLTNFTEFGDTDDNKAGFFYIQVNTGNKTYYEYYYIGTYLRFRMGWKLGHIDEIMPPRRIQDVFDIGPSPLWPTA